MTVRAFRFGGLAQDSIDGVQTVAADTGGSKYMTLESPVGTDYQVPSGYTFYITQISFGTTAAVVFGYGDDGVAYLNNNPPTNWVAVTSRIYPGSIGNLAVLIPIPSGKYPCTFGITSGNYVTCYGIEIPD